MADPEAASRFRAYPYDRVAWCYDALAALYSAGRIGRSRRHHVAWLARGDHVLYAGVGRGREAIAAARRGAVVTAVDLAPSMLARVDRAAQREGVSIELLEGDVSEVTSGRRFDWVVGHYFLNLFEAPVGRAMLRVLIDRTRVGGRVCLADFAPATTGAASAAWRTRAYYAPLNAIASTLGFCARHPIPDLARWCEEEGLHVLDRSRFPLPGVDAPAYWTVIAERLGDPPERVSGRTEDAAPGGDA